MKKMGVLLLKVFIFLVAVSLTTAAVFETNFLVTLAIFSFMVSAVTGVLLLIILICMFLKKLGFNL